MSDLLRLLRVARTFGGLVGLYRHGWFRLVAVALTVAGLAVAYGGSVFGSAVLAVSIVFAVWAVRRVLYGTGAHRA